MRGRELVERDKSSPESARYTPTSMSTNATDTTNTGDQPDTTNTDAGGSELPL